MRGYPRGTAGSIAGGLARRQRELKNQTELTLSQKDLLQSQREHMRSFLPEIYNSANQKQSELNGDLDTMGPENNDLFREYK